MKDNPKWKKFEALAAEIQKELSPQAKVEHDVKIKGEDSKVDRQIDISVRQNIGQYSLLIVIQCKDEKAPLDVNVVGEFASVVNDVRAQKGALVSSSGFTAAAVNLAKQKGIDLFRLVDVENKDWRTYASLPAAAVFDEMEGYQLRFANNPIFPPERFTIPIKLLEDIPNLPLHREDGTLIDTAINAIGAAWNSGKLPKKSGEYFDLKFIDEPVFLKDGENLIPVVLTANIITRQRIFFGHIPILSMRGFQDVATGGVHMRSFTTDWLNLEAIEKGWQLVESLEQLAVQPVLVLHGSNSHDLLKPQANTSTVPPKTD
ncbi:MAG: restriction endonuclease [Candidatus Yanofskybacteria bacterium]|nr:restriction endonuclease [Candidatus Yanofskybacteria bacterium]